MIDPVMNKINYETENTAEKVVNSLMYRVHENFFQLFSASLCLEYNYSGRNKLPTCGK